MKILLKFFKVITTHNWRCHRRCVILQRMFKNLEHEACHELAGKISYYPTEKKRIIYIRRIVPSFKSETVTIRRICPSWLLLLGFGKFEVDGMDEKYQKWIFLWWFLWWWTRHTKSHCNSGTSQKEKELDLSPK